MANLLILFLEPLSCFLLLDASAFVVVVVASAFMFVSLVPHTRNHGQIQCSKSFALFPFQEFYGFCSYI